MSEFINYCQKGDLIAAKEFFIRNPSLKISAGGCEAFVVACINGNIDIIKWLYSIKSTVINRACNFPELVNDIIESGEKEVLSYIKEIRKIEFHNEHFSNACKFGWFNIVKMIYLSSNNIDISYNFDEPFRLACENGHALIAEWLLEKKSNIDISAFNEHAFRKACENGHYGIAKWLLELKSNINIREWNDYAIKYASIYGDIEIVKWLNNMYIINDLFNSHKEKLELFSTLFKYACKNGSYDLARWLYYESEKRVNILEAFSKAFSNGNIEIVDWLYSLAEAMGGKLTADLILKAEECGKKVVQKGGIEVMRWLYKIKGYSCYHTDYFKLAIISGHYKLAKWLYSVNQDVKISENDEEIFCVCCEKGYDDIVEWLLKVKPDINIVVNNNYPFVIACENGHFDVATILYKFNSGTNMELNSFFYAFVLSSVAGNIKIAKWLYSIKPELIEIGVQEGSLKDFFEHVCCEVGKLEIAKWLYTILPSIYLTTGQDTFFINACKKGFVEIAEWLQGIKPERYKLTIELESIIDYDIITVLPISSNIVKLKNVDSCPICCDDNNKVNLQTDCGHNFCTPCMRYYWTKNNSCPYCRSLIKLFNKIELLIN